MRSSSRKAMIAVALFSFSLSLIIRSAIAASGGRMGGDSFSSSSSSSSSSDDYSSSHYYNNHHGSYTRTPTSSSDGDSSTWPVVIIICGFFGFYLWVSYYGDKGNGGCVIMVQVGLTGKASRVQKELNEIAKTTDTSTSNGWKRILTETSLALLRNEEHFTSAYSSVKRHESGESLEKNFKHVSMEEREKIDVESLVNVNNVRTQRSVIPKANKLCKSYIVVTMLAAAKGWHKVPAIRSVADLKEVFRFLGSTSAELLAVEVLWTPQEETDTLSEEELFENYPLLKPI